MAANIVSERFLFLGKFDGPGEGAARIAEQDDGRRIGQ